MAIEASIRSGATSGTWLPCPIVKDWILEGNPVARNEFLSGSADGMANTFYWDCTAGRFNWFYSFDETLQILEGSVTLKDPQGRSTRVVPGDVIFFPAGSRAEWTVHGYVRKLAFCRTPLPAPLVLARHWLQRLKRLVRGGAPAPGMFPAS
jgi:uncharacterized cupin superfamily protein